MEDDLLRRYYTFKGWFTTQWAYRMANSRRPLQERMTLFWHQVFPVSVKKSDHTSSSNNQIVLFRRIGMTDMRTILSELSRDPAMIFWLDNNENHSDEPNENYGRELLELFSMGVGNYTEADVKAATRAFTGWTHSTPLPGLGPTDKYPAHFIYDDDDHDDGIKNFLGETGRFNGDDIVDVIVRQPATARFIARHFYDYFVADEPPVSAWSQIPAQDPDAIDALVAAYFESGGAIRPMLRTLFNADFFKTALYRKVKGPADMSMGVLKLIGTHRTYDPGVSAYLSAVSSMGQSLMNPTTVEGWMTGPGWIDGGALSRRIEFAVEQVGDPSHPGIQGIVERLTRQGETVPPETVVDRCLDYVGPLPIGAATRESLARHVGRGGPLNLGTPVGREAAARRVASLLQLIVATREYQFC